jgi:hypothetical protein
LKDEALRAIESLSISGDNYVNAIELLRKRFENKRLIVQEHVSNILSMSPILKSSHIELRGLIDTINNNIAVLEVLDIKTDSCDALLVPIVLEKLDFMSKKEWQTTLEKDVPTYKSFNDFLEKRYQILQATSNMRSNENNSTSNAFKGNKYHQKGDNTSQKENPNSSTKSNKFSSNFVSSNGCFICKEQHNVFHCKDF